MESLLELHHGCVSSPAEMSSMSFCHSCKVETKYICLICQGPVCNRPEYTVFLPEETPNWESGFSVSACLPCTCNTGSKLKLTANDTTKQDVPVIAPQTSNDQSAGAKPQKIASQTTDAKETAKRNCLQCRPEISVLRRHTHVFCAHVFLSVRLEMRI